MIFEIWLTSGQLRLGCKSGVGLGLLCLCSYGSGKFLGSFPCCSCSWLCWWHTGCSNSCSNRSGAFHGFTCFLYNYCGVWWCCLTSSALNFQCCYFLSYKCIKNWQLLQFVSNNNSCQQSILYILALHQGPFTKVCWPGKYSIQWLCMDFTLVMAAWAISVNTPISIRAFLGLGFIFTQRLNTFLH